MLKRLLIVLLVALSISLLVTEPAFGWGGRRSFAGSGRYGGSFTHTRAVTGGPGGETRYGASTYTGPGGQTYSASHQASIGYGGVSRSGTYAGPHGSGSYSGHASYSGYHSEPAYGDMGYHEVPHVSGVYGSGFAGGAVPAETVTPTRSAATMYAQPDSGVYVHRSPGVMTTPGGAVVATNTRSISVLPAGYETRFVNDQTYYQCGDTWYQMQGARYVVVPRP